MLTGLFESKFFTGGGGGQFDPRSDLGPEENFAWLWKHI